MSTLYRSRDGDMVDLIGLDAAGGPIGAEAIYNANPHLAAYGPRLPAGVIIRLPAPAADIAPVTALLRPIRLWGAPA